MVWDVPQRRRSSPGWLGQPTRARDGIPLGFSERQRRGIFVERQFIKWKSPVRGGMGGEDAAPDGAGKFLRRVATKMARLRRSGQPQRGCSLQPSVAAQRLRWVRMGKENNPEGVEAVDQFFEGRNPFRVVEFVNPLPKVGAAHQPWAVGWNAVGVPKAALAVHPKHENKSRVPMNHATFVFSVRRRTEPQSGRLRSPVSGLVRAK